MDDEYDFGGWLTEDLKELYSDRAELNNMMLIILSEIQSRGRN